MTMDSMTSRTSNPRLQRLQEKVESYVADDKLYEAEQIYLTICSRLFGTEQYEEAIEVAVKGALRLLSLHSGKAGAKLAMQVLDFFKATKQPISDTNIGIITRIFRVFSDENKTEKVNFMKAAIKWSMTPPSGYSLGHPTLQLEFAKYYQNSGAYGEANKHFLKSHNDEMHFKMLVDWSNKVEPNEKDLLFTRTILQYLTLENVEGAQKLFARFPQDLQTPLMNFTRLLLEAIRRDSAPLFQMLRFKYSISIQRDPSFAQFFDRIGMVCFHIEPADGRGMGGFLSQLFSNIAD